jgi:hypothetical protein
MKVEVRRYRKDDGWPTRNWAVYVDGEFLAVVLYRKGAEAVADKLLDLAYSPPRALRVAEE